MIVYRTIQGPLVKGSWQKSLIFDWGIHAALRHIALWAIIPPSALRAATSPIGRGWDSAINDHIQKEGESHGSGRNNTAPGRIVG